MLESYLGARGATQGDAEALDRLAGDLKAHFALAARGHADLKGVLDAQNDRIVHLSDELQRVRAADAEQVARLEQINRQMAANTRLLRITSLLTMILLLVCTVLLLLLLRRH